uniref:Uncharacterized protein n=1 Tax=Romanomermis culicivorax TaxID=13658 RepID=A0A915KSD2_ROMCU
MGLWLTNCEEHTVLVILIAATQELDDALDSFTLKKEEIETVVLPSRPNAIRRSLYSDVDVVPVELDVDRDATE